MPTITITLSVTVPDGVEVVIDTATQTVETPALLPDPIVHITDDAIPAQRGESVAWSEEEDAVLADTTLSHADCAELMGRSYHAVASRRYSLGIRMTDRVRLIREASRAMQRWTEAEVQYVAQRSSEDVDDATIASELGRSEDAVRVRRQQLIRTGVIQVIKED